MSETRFTKEHEWIRIEGDAGTVGITRHAVEQLGDIVFYKAPDIGTAFKPGEETSTVESVKTASEVYAPLAGTVTEVNGGLADKPQLINEDAEGAGWLFKLKLADAGEAAALMTADEYAEFAEG
jgi:glycine cleavage system H protein